MIRHFFFFYWDARQILVPSPVVLKNSFIIPFCPSINLMTLYFDPDLMQEQNLALEYLDLVPLVFLDIYSSLQFILT